ncbi:MAG: sodium:proton antiporter [Nitrososphaeraceae archaeon]
MISSYSNVALKFYSNFYLQHRIFFKKKSPIIPLIYQYLQISSQSFLTVTCYCLLKTGHKFLSKSKLFFESAQLQNYKLCVFTATISMFIDNVTTVLLMVPVTISVFRSIKLSPIPFVIAMVLASNVGGAATLIGDPPNIMIGSAAGIDFNAFIIHMGPTVAISFCVSLLLLRYLFRNELKARIDDRGGIMKENEYAYLKDIKTLKKSLGVLIGVIVLFVLHGILDLELIIVWLSALSSAFVDNIPFTATMIPVIDSLNENSIIASAFDSFQISPLWWALSLGANFGGNGTSIGSSAAIIAVGLAEKLHYGITFNRFIKVGFPFMVLILLAGTLVLLIDTLLRI